MGPKNDTIQQNIFHRDDESKFVWLQFNNSVSINKATISIDIIKSHTELFKKEFNVNLSILVLDPASFEVSQAGRGTCLHAEPCPCVPEDPDNAGAHVLVAAALLQRHAELGDGTAAAEPAPRQGEVGQGAQSGRELHREYGNIHEPQLLPAQHTGVEIQ